jgi:hypothetical protein
MKKFDEKLKRLMENMTASFFSGGATTGNVAGDMRSGDFYAPKDARLPKVLGMKKSGKKKTKIPIVKRTLNDR